MNIAQRRRAKTAVLLPLASSVPKPIWIPVRHKISVTRMRRRIRTAATARNVMKGCISIAVKSLAGQYALYDGWPCRCSWQGMPVIVIDNRVGTKKYRH